MMFSNISRWGYPDILLHRNCAQFFYCFKSDVWYVVLHQYVHSCTISKSCMLWGLVYKRSQSFLIDYFFLLAGGRGGQRESWCEAEPVRRIHQRSQGLLYWNIFPIYRKGGSLEIFVIFINAPKVRYIEMLSRQIPSAVLLKYLSFSSTIPRSVILKYLPHRSQGWFCWNF